MKEIEQLSVSVDNAKDEDHDERVKQQEAFLEGQRFTVEAIRKLEQRQSDMERKLDSGQAQMETSIRKMHSDMKRLLSEHMSHLVGTGH